MQTERIEGAGQDAGRAAGLAGSSLWLISRDKGGSPNPPLEPLLVDDDRSGGTLAVFGHEEEAEMFLWFGALGGGWRVREAGARELASFSAARPGRGCDAWPSTRFRGTSPGRRSISLSASTGTGSRSASLASHSEDRDARVAL